MASRTITYSDDWQSAYTYERTEAVGTGFDPAFRPHLTPQQMLSLGVFGGAYFEGVQGGIPSDLPASWFAEARLSPDNTKQKEYNFFQVSASQSIDVWRQKGWIHPDDPHGWFQWYCRYYVGRRLPAEDARQIQRWRAIRRHVMQIKKNCRAGDITCRPRQRQAVLQWGYDGRTL